MLFCIIVWFINILPYCSKMINLEVEYRKCPRVLKPMSSQYKLEHLSLILTHENMFQAFIF